MDAALVLALHQLATTQAWFGAGGWTRPGTDPRPSAPLCGAWLCTPVSARCGLLVSQRSHACRRGVDRPDAVAGAETGDRAAHLGADHRICARRRRRPLSDRYCRQRASSVGVGRRSLGGVATRAELAQPAPLGWTA